MCQCGGICISAVPLLESREVHGSYSAGVIGHLIWLSQLTWCWEQNLGLLQEQSWLLTEKQSLQSQLPFFASLPPPFFSFSSLRLDLIQSKMASKSSIYSRIVVDFWPSCLLFQSSEVTGIHQYTWFFLPCWEGTQDFMDTRQALYKLSYIPSLPILKENETLILALYLPLENILWEHKYFRQLQFYWTFL